MFDSYVLIIRRIQENWLYEKEKCCLAFSCIILLLHWKSYIILKIAQLLTSTKNERKM